jgi:cytochrome c553
MPEQARQLMREDMLDHLSALNEIIGYLGENNLAAAADVAETRMGKSSMGKHRATGMGPGRFMPIEMRNLGWGMHESATEFALVAKEGDLKNANSALQKVITSCVACHYSYRTR